MRWTVEAEPGAGIAADDAARVLLTQALRNAAVVARSRTTLTERGELALPAGDVPVHRKVYRYATARDRLRGVLRTTFLAPSRARRERDALRALRVLGPPALAPEPVALLEARHGGLLAEAWLLTRSVADAADPAALRPSRELAAALGACLGRIHAAGHVRVDAAPRNFLCVPDARGEFGVLKVDSGRMAAGRPRGAAAARDLATLVAGLEGTWDADALAALVTAYGGATGGAVPRWEPVLEAARRGLARRRPRGEA